LLLLAELAARCFTITKRRAEKFSNDFRTFARIIFLYRLLYATIIKQELSASIFRATSVIKRLVPMPQSIWSQTPAELHLHVRCCKIVRCHVGQNDFVDQRLRYAYFCGCKSVSNSVSISKTIISIISPPKASGLF
jgi:hypothetical protein